MYSNCLHFKSKIVRLIDSNLHIWILNIIDSIFWQAQKLLHWSRMFSMRQRWVNMFCGFAEQSIKRNIHSYVYFLILITLPFIYCLSSNCDKSFQYTVNRCINCNRVSLMRMQWLHATVIKNRWSSALVFTCPISCIAKLCNVNVLLLGKWECNEFCWYSGNVHARLIYPDY